MHVDLMYSIEDPNITRTIKTKVAYPVLEGRESKLNGGNS